MATIYTAIAANKRKSTMLVFVVVAVLAAIGYFLGYLTDARGAFLLLAIAFAIVSSLIGYYGGDKIALWSVGAQALVKEDNPYLFRMVENLCITSGLPMPNIYLIDDDTMNAFATGRDPRHASLAVTRGIVEKLHNEELEGVLAHELSHIGNYDIRFLTLVGVLVGVIVLLSDLFTRSLWWGGARRRNERSGVGGIMALVGLLLLLLSPLIAQLIKLAVSRRREFLADASGALLTRYPEGLASALEKIGGDGQPLQRASSATAHLFIANPFGRRRMLGGLFSTHPPIEERVKALRAMGGTA